MRHRGGYYGTLDGQQIAIDLAFYGIGQGFDFIAGRPGVYTGYYILLEIGSQEWIDFMNTTNN